MPICNGCCCQMRTMGKKCHQMVVSEETHRAAAQFFFATVPLHHHSALLNIYKHRAPVQPRDALRALISEVRWIINITRRLCRNVWKGWFWSIMINSSCGKVRLNLWTKNVATASRWETCKKTMHANILEGPAKTKNAIVADVAETPYRGTNCFPSALNINTASCTKLQQRSGKRNHGTLGDMPSQCGSTLYNCVSFLDS